ncbi:hypothetical protein THAOC_33519, partial [Thalassiosira oceanica]
MSRAKFIRGGLGNMAATFLLMEPMMSPSLGIKACTPLSDWVAGARLHHRTPRRPGCRCLLGGGRLALVSRTVRPGADWGPPSTEPSTCRPRRRTGSYTYVRNIACQQERVYNNTSIPRPYCTDEGEEASRRGGSYVRLRTCYLYLHTSHPDNNCLPGAERRPTSRPKTSVIRRWAASADTRLVNGVPILPWEIHPSAYFLGAPPADKLAIADINKGRQAASRKGTAFPRPRHGGSGPLRSSRPRWKRAWPWKRGPGRGKGLVELTLLSDLEMSFFRRGSRTLVVEKGWEGSGQDPALHLFRQRNNLSFGFGNVIRSSIHSDHGAKLPIPADHIIHHQAGGREKCSRFNLFFSRPPTLRRQQQQQQQQERINKGRQAASRKGTAFPRPRRGGSGPLRSSRPRWKRAWPWKAGPWPWKRTGRVNLAFGFGNVIALVVEKGSEGSDKTRPCTFPDREITFLSAGEKSVRASTISSHARQPCDEQQQQQQQQQERINAGPEVSTFPDAGPEVSTFPDAGPEVSTFPDAGPEVSTFPDAGPE